MSKHMSQLRSLALGLLAASLWLAGCGGSGGQKPRDNIDLNSYGRAKLLYAESVQFPDSMVANDPFDVHIKVSAALEPELLRGVGRLVTFEDSGGKFLFGPQLTGSSLTDPPDTVLFETWVPFVTWDGIPILFDDPPSDTATLRMALPAGHYVFKVSSADIPERGGMEGKYLSTPSYGPLPTEHAVNKEYPFTVHP